MSAVVMVGDRAREVEARGTAKGSTIPAWDPALGDMEPHRFMEAPYAPIWACDVSLAEETS